MHCPRCGGVTRPGSRFCTGCGSPVAPVIMPSNSTAAVVAAGSRHYELASVRRRFAALLIDGAPGTFVFYAVFFALLAATGGSDDDPEPRSASLLLGGWLLSFYVALWLWEALGWTPGKRALGLRVIREDGARPGWLHGLVRGGGRVLSTCPVYLGYLWALGDARKRTWHDRMARTLVVRAGEGFRFEPATPPDPPPAAIGDDDDEAWIGAALSGALPPPGAPRPGEAGGRLRTQRPHAAWIALSSLVVVVGIGSSLLFWGGAFPGASFAFDWQWPGEFRARHPLPSEEELAAATPTLAAADGCTGVGRQVCLVPVGGEPQPSLEPLADYYAATLDLSIEVLPRIGLSGEAAGELIDRARDQLNGAGVIDLMRRTYPELWAEPGVTLIGITDHDLFSSTSAHLRYVFAGRSQRSIGGGFAIVSTARFDPAAYIPLFGAKPPQGFAETTESRLRRAVTKQIGLLHVGLEPSGEPTSAVYCCPNSIDDLDSMSPRLDFGPSPPPPRSGPAEAGWFEAEQMALHVQELASGLAGSLLPTTPLPGGAPAEASSLPTWTLAASDLGPGASVSYEGFSEHPDAVAAYTRAFRGSVAPSDARDGLAYSSVSAHALLYNGAEAATEAAERMWGAFTEEFDDQLQQSGLVAYDRPPTSGDVQGTSAWSFPYYVKVVEVRAAPEESQLPPEAAHAPNLVFVGFAWAPVGPAVVSVASVARVPGGRGGITSADPWHPLIRTFEQRVREALRASLVEPSDGSPAATPVLTICDGHSRAAPCALAHPVESSGAYRSEPVLWGLPALEVCVELLDSPRSQEPLTVRLASDDPLTPAPPAELEFTVESSSGECGRISVETYVTGRTTRSVLEVGALADAEWRLSLRERFAAMTPDRGTSDVYTGEGLGSTAWFYVDAPFWQACWQLVPIPPAARANERPDQPRGTDGRLQVTGYGFDGGSRLVRHDWDDLVEGDSDCAVMPTGGIVSVSIGAYGRGAPWRVRIEPLDGTPPYEVREAATWSDLADQMQIDVETLAAANAALYALDDELVHGEAELVVPAEAPVEVRDCNGLPVGPGLNGYRT